MNKVKRFKFIKKNTVEKVYTDFLGAGMRRSCGSHFGFSSFLGIVLGSRVLACNCLLENE